MDTACSSSGVAIDYASRSLQQGQCDRAIVCAVHSVLSPTSSIFLSKARLISPFGRCATFDASADGYCRSEGYGAIVLERMSDAIENRRWIWGLIKGSAVNHSGMSNGLTAPSTFAQRDVIQMALRDAQVDPEDISLVEAHGTGTPVGDPIEIVALREIYAKSNRTRPLHVASVKTNIGHCEPSRWV